MSSLSSSCAKEEREREGEVFSQQSLELISTNRVIMTTSYDFSKQEKRLYGQWNVANGLRAGCKERIR